MTHETLLVIDDSCDMQDILANDILGSMGYKVITASDGRTGLQMAIEHNPDLILLDMNMPRMNGLQMLTALRQTACSSPVIFMTVYVSEGLAVEAFRLGVRDYLTKPFTADEVTQAVNQALRETRLAREREALNRSLVTAEAVRVTVVTLSHYLNNYQMALFGGLRLLEEKLQQELPDPELLQHLHNCYKS